MRYYDLRRNWRKVSPHLSDPALNSVLVRDFNKYTSGRWGRPFLPGMCPRQFESCDWDVDHKGRQPEFWRYVKHAACHWLVNFTLRLAELTEPDSAWRIITSQKHSTVWDGGRVLFDFNFQAMGIPARECFARANERELVPGKRLQVYRALPSSVESLAG